MIALASTQSNQQRVESRKDFSKPEQTSWDNRKTFALKRNKKLPLQVISTREL